MNKLAADDCEQLITLRERPRLIASHSVPHEKARLEQLARQRLVSAVVYQQGGVIYGLTRAGQHALQRECPQVDPGIPPKF